VSIQQHRSLKTTALCLHFTQGTSDELKFSRIACTRKLHNAKTRFDLNQSLSQTSQDGQRIGPVKQPDHLASDQRLAQPWMCMSNSRIKRGEIYHLVAERGNYTLCGLRISLFNIPAKKIGDDKEPVFSQRESLCKHCKRIEKQDE